MNRFVPDPDAVPNAYNPMRELIDESVTWHMRRLSIGLIVYGAIMVLWVHLPSYIVSKSSIRMLRALRMYHSSESIDNVRLFTTSQFHGAHSQGIPTKVRSDQTSLRFTLLTLLLYVITPFIISHVKPKQTMKWLTKVWFNKVTTVLGCKEYLLIAEANDNEVNGNGRNLNANDRSGRNAEAIEAPIRMGLRAFAIFISTSAVVICLCSVTTLIFVFVGLHFSSFFPHTVAIDNLDSFLAGGTVFCLTTIFVYNTGKETLRDVRYFLVPRNMRRQAGLHEDAIANHSMRSLGTAIICSFISLLQWMSFAVMWYIVLPMFIGKTLNVTFFCSLVRSSLLEVQRWDSGSLYQNWALGLIAGRFIHDMKKYVPIGGENEAATNDGPVYDGREDVNGRTRSGYSQRVTFVNVKLLQYAMNRSIWRHRKSLQLLDRVALPLCLLFALYLIVPVGISSLAQRISGEEAVAKNIGLYGYLLEALLVTALSLVPLLRKYLNIIHTELKDELYLIGRQLHDYKDENAFDDKQMKLKEQETHPQGGKEFSKNPQRQAPRETLFASSEGLRRRNL